MNQNYVSYIRNARMLAETKGIQWDIQCDQSGFAHRPWDLTKMSGAAPPPTITLQNFTTDERTIDVINARRQVTGETALNKIALPEEWRELIKASVIHQIYVRRNTPAHILNAVIRPLVVLATCAQTSEPWRITSVDVEHAFATAGAVQASGKLADLVFGAVKTIIDLNHLADCGPLSSTLIRRKEFRGKRAKFAKAINHLASNLSDRKRAERLP